VLKKLFSGKNINTFIVASGVILIWRGVWGFMDVYFFPENPVLSYIFSILIGLIIIIADDFLIDELKHR
jgi:uncharacterized membrane-anchored protein